MDKVFNWVKAAIAAIGGLIGWFFGPADGLFYALVSFVILDYITGVMRAIIDKELSSGVGFKGIFRKVLIFALVGLGHILDMRVLGNPDGSALRTAIIFFYLSNEGISILENTAYLGLPIPEKLKEILAQLRDNEDKGSGHQTQ